MPARVLVLVALALAVSLPELEAQDAKKKGPATRVEAEAELRKLVDRWLDDRAWVKLLERGDRTGIKIKPRAVAKVTWDLLPMAVREGHDRDRWLAELQANMVPRWGGFSLPHDGARVERVDLSRDVATVVVRTARVLRADQDQSGRVTVTKDEERAEDATTWVKQAGRFVLAARLDGRPLRPTPAGEQLFADEWFAEKSLSLRAVGDRLEAVTLPQDATDMERQRLREQAAKDMEGAEVADFGSIVNVRADGMATIRVGDESCNRVAFAWVPETRHAALTELRVGARVRFRGTVDLQRDIGVNVIELRDAEVEALR